MGENSRSLLRQQLQRRSDTGFLDRLHAEFQDVGFSSGHALACLRAVVNSPGAALIKKGSTGRREHLHAVLIKDADLHGGAHLITARVAVNSGKPPQVVDSAVHMQRVDLTDPDGQAELCAQMEEWWREFDVRELMPKPARRTDLAWLGDPRSSGYYDVPADWDTRLRAVASVLGMDIRPVVNANQLNARQAEVFDTSDIVALLHGWPPGRRLKTDTKLEPTPLVVGSAGSTFSELLMDVRQRLLPIALGAERDPFEPRELKPGEIVFHRKLDKSHKSKKSRPPDYDHFDAGSSQPCGHGEEGFEVYKSADKATKGMARRYTNFWSDDIQLKHCGKAPNCGMYAVKRQRARLDPV